jgi:hypothetical protein
MAERAVPKTRVKQVVAGENNLVAKVKILDVKQIIDDGAKETIAKLDSLAHAENVLHEAAMGVIHDALSITIEAYTQPLTDFRKKKLTTVIYHAIHAAKEQYKKENGQTEDGIARLGAEIVARGEVNKKDVDRVIELTPRIIEAQKTIKGRNLLTAFSVTLGEDNAGEDMLTRVREATKHIPDPYNVAVEQAMMDFEIAQIDTILAQGNRRRERNARNNQLAALQEMTIVLMATYPYADIAAVKQSYEDLARKVLGITHEKQLGKDYTLFTGESKPTAATEARVAQEKKKMEQMLQFNPVN